MKKFTCFLTLSVLSAQAVFCQATNQIHLVPTDNIAAARSSVWEPDFGRITTNTPAFEKYAVNFMLKQANEMRTNWNLDIPKPLTINDIVFSLQATPYGIEGFIDTRDGRFVWWFEWNVLTGFQDHKYWPRSFQYHWDEEAQLAKIKSKIDAKEAEVIARNALHKLGLTEKQLHLIEPPRVNQYKFEETNGIVYPLPMFNVGWVVEGFTDPDVPSVVFDVSGITKTVAEYSNPHTPRVPLPANYFQMLNLPTNYLETLSPRERSRLHLPPLTNSPPQITNSLK
jgi:hypothetical protein